MKNISAMIAAWVILLSSTATGSDLAGVRAKLQRAYPDIKIDSVAPSAQVKGWLEVATSDRLLYTSEDGNLLFVGTLVETSSKGDLTSKRWAELNRIDYASLPFDNAITVRHGAGTREITVFSDPHCPFCQQLEQQLSSIDNLTVHSFLYPLESVHPGATAEAERIWCAPDRAKAWNNWMVGKAFPRNAADCDTSVLKSLRELGLKLKINSTPTIFLPDGRRLNGAVSNEEISRMLDEADKKRSVAGK